MFADVTKQNSEEKGELLINNVGTILFYMEKDKDYKPSRKQIQKILES